MEKITKDELIASAKEKKQRLNIVWNNKHSAKRSYDSACFEADELTARIQKINSQLPEADQVEIETEPAYKKEIL